MGGAEEGQTEKTYSLKEEENKTVVQGRLCADPEMRQTQSGISVCSFRVAWSEKYKDTERKLFLSCTAWRGMADMICGYFYKGKEIVVEGSLHTEEYTDKEGTKRSAIKLNVDRVHFCGSRSDADGAPASAPATGGFTELPPGTDDELPF